MKTKIFFFLAAMLLSVSAFAQSESTLKGDVNEDGKVDVADINAIIKIMKDGGGTAEEEVFYWYIGTDENAAKSLPTSDSQLATGTGEGWRKYTNTTGVIYDASTTANQIRFDHNGWYWLVIKNGVNVVDGFGSNVLDNNGTFLIDDSIEPEYAPDSNTITGYTIYSSRTSGAIFGYTVKNGVTIPTAINSVSRKDSAKNIYNVNGQQIGNTQKGINIVDGKKVIIR